MVLLYGQTRLAFLSTMESLFCIYCIFLSYADVEMCMIICHMKLVCRKLN